MELSSYAEAVGGVLLEGRLASSEPGGPLVTLVVCARVGHRASPAFRRLFSVLGWPGTKEGKQPYHLLVDEAALEAARTGRGTAEAIAAVDLTYARQGAGARNAPLLRRQAAELAGRWVQAVAVPRTYSFAGRYGRRLELLALAPIP